MRSKKEILDDFEYRNADTGRTYDADAVTQMKLLVEVLCDIREILSKLQEGANDR